MPRLSLSCQFALLLLGSFTVLAPGRAEPPSDTVTICQRGPIETVSSNGEVSSVAMATVGTHYTLVSVQGAQVMLQDSSGTHYLIALNCTDCPPPAPAPLPPASPTPAPPPPTLINSMPQPAAAAIVTDADPQPITPGEIWPDDRGKHVQAHGGGIIKLGDTWYWFGEDRSKDNPPGIPIVSCYSSKDLAHWQFRNQVEKAEDPAKLGAGWILERPKVFYNQATKKYVMYVHIDTRNYQLANVGVFICDTIDGDYQFVKNFRPLNHQSRDIGQFIDDDGSAYLISEDRPLGFHIYKLSDDYLTVEQDMHLFPKEQGGSLEGGALVHYKDLYYVVGSKMSGWNPNPNKYATSPSLEGPWSEFHDIAPPEKNTYNSQSTMLLKVVGSKTTSVIFMGDWWVHTDHPLNLADARYIWMPFEIGDGKLWVPEPKPWTINVETGETTINP